MYGGKLLSEPTTDTAEQDVVFDSRTGAMTFGHHQWSGKAVNKRTGATLTIDSVDHPPAVPAACVTGTACDQQGESSWITTEFGSSTPTGAGEEVVLDRKGCVIRAAAGRGTSLAAGQTAIQATGSDATALQQFAGRGACFRLGQSLRDEQGHAVRLSRSTYGVNGRYRLVAGGEIVAPSGTGSMFDRNPRTILGRTADGRISLITIDGRMTTSVGTTIAETAAVAKSLGLSDATNLDGGGSTTLASPTGALNTPSGSGGSERLVGDAVVWVP
ncbi:MAG TPA: phosphodiester glycosidase family protein [Flexivirga sp.]|uniref:phosphodiester glycosidase family protein n=1 Tax=Flexivirga sp. TaxID=1962927 RepID=UPI002BAF5550|nr:phosphodiester glycosidase family protein [Flexivirga sp.]HWC22945.1 phosphodiester glycosidase family protein [Flexivirga sp.]